MIATSPVGPGASLALPCSAMLRAVFCWAGAATIHSDTKAKLPRAAVGAWPFILRSIYLRRISGVLMGLSGLGLLTYLVPPLAHAVSPTTWFLTSSEKDR